MTTRNFILSYLSSVEGILKGIQSDKLEQIIDVIFAAYKRDQQIFLVGNGGGAATAMHFTCDLNKTAIVPGRRRMRAMSLSDNTSLVTAWANDTQYTNIFGEQLVNFARPGDLVIGFTASGMSVNILNAIALANEVGCTTIAFVGFDGGTVGAIAHHVLHIPSNSYQHIEDVHLLLCHVITNALQERARSDESLSTEASSDAFEERSRRISYATQVLAAERSRSNRLRMVPEQIARTIGFETAILFEVEDGGLRMASGYNARDGASPIDMGEDYYETEAVREGRTIVVADVEDDPRVPAGHPAYTSLQSYVLAPVMKDNRAVALLIGGYTSEQKAVTPRDEQLLRLFAYSVRGALTQDEKDDPESGWWAVS
ncbi:MAG: SIS domain-containing protein [Actinomycetota bacterium]|nr:SIS domain-containing protein [Actinomycetota bacterium]